MKKRDDGFRADTGSGRESPPPFAPIGGGCQFLHRAIRPAAKGHYVQRAGLPEVSRHVETARVRAAVISSPVCGRRRPTPAIASSDNFGFIVIRPFVFSCDDADKGNGNSVLKTVYLYKAAGLCRLR